MNLDDHDVSLVPQGRQTIRQACRSERPYFPRMPSTACLRHSGLQVALRNVLEYLLLKRQIGDQTLEAAILSRSRFFIRHLIEFKPAVFLSPAIITLLRNVVFSARHRRHLPLRHQHFDRTQQHNDLLCLEPLLRHHQSCFQSSFSHRAWSKKARSGRSCPRVASNIVGPAECRTPMNR